MATINTYLNFKGNCEDAFNFYKSVFGGAFTYIGRFVEMPPQAGVPPISEADQHKIMHIGLPIGNTVLMGSDTIGEWALAFAQGNNFSINLRPDSKAEADKLFNELSAGGQVIMPMANTFWGAYFGMFTDKFGINWMINMETNQTEP